MNRLEQVQQLKQLRSAAVDRAEAALGQAKSTLDALHQRIAQLRQALADQSERARAERSAMLERTRDKPLTSAELVRANQQMWHLHNARHDLEAELQRAIAGAREAEQAVERARADLMRARGRKTAVETVNDVISRRQRVAAEEISDEDAAELHQSRKDAEGQG